MNDWIDKQFDGLKETNYKAFNEKLISTSYPVLGIRIPALKKLAGEIANDAKRDEYLLNAEFKTYEHIMLYGLVLGKCKNMPLETLFNYLDPLILKFDNWAHVDVIICTLKVFHKYPEEVFKHFLPLKYDKGEFTKRTFVVVLMAFYLNDTYIYKVLKHMTEVLQGQYYVDMALAWAMSVALVKHYDQALPLLETPVFSKFVHNKSIQKARESFRISAEIKEYLKGFKI
jgi:Predicted DNA alkylation repair enzyme